MKKKYEAGECVTSLEELKSLRVVYVVPWKRAHPVAFFLSWQWRLVDNWVRRGYMCRAEAIKGIQPFRSEETVRA